MIGERLAILLTFGTRPEALKLVPLIHELKNRQLFEVIVGVTSQHRELLADVLRRFDVTPNWDLDLMRDNQQLSNLFARLLQSIDAKLADSEPHIVVVQGDTTTAAASCLAAFHRGIPVAHVEAGLRSGDPRSPFPEEMNRRMITQMASFHFAATELNRQTLRRENVAETNIFVAGNTIVDMLRTIRNILQPSTRTKNLISKELSSRKLLLVTSHRRENFGQRMGDYLGDIANFLRESPNVFAVFPVHPNPNVKRVVENVFDRIDNIRLVGPLGYDDFLYLLSQASLIASDSGGVQEEAPSFGKPVLIMRENTERPEVISSGHGRLVAPAPGNLLAELRAAFDEESWATRLSCKNNPFGDGHAANRIADVLETVF